MTHFKPGEAVYGVSNAAFAEYAPARPDKLAPMPANLSFEQAAAVPVSAVTALQALRDRGRLKAGQHVLVIGASGGVGTFAVQIAKALGATVTGVCSTAKLDLVRSLGADHVIDYTQADITDDGRRYDLVLDIGGNRPLSAAPPRAHPRRDAGDRRRRRRRPLDRRPPPPARRHGRCRCSCASASGRSSPSPTAPTSTRCAR